MSKILKAHLAVLTANLIYGANYSIAKLAMPKHIKPYGFILLRVFVACILFFITGFFLKKEKIEKKDWLRLFACGMAGVAINQLFFFKGLSLTLPINAALMMTTNPILVLIMAHFLIREMISVQKIIGIIIGLSGAVLLIACGKTINFSGESVKGDAMVFLNSLSWALFMILVKPLMMKYHPVTIMKWSFAFGLPVVIIFGYDELQTVNWSGMSFHVLLSVMYVVIAVTFLAYMLNVMALNRLSPSVVSFYIYLQPLFAVLFSFVFATGIPHWIHFFSALLIFTGVYLVSYTPKNQKIMNSQS